MYVWLHHYKETPLLSVFVNSISPHNSYSSNNNACLPWKSYMVLLYAVVCVAHFFQTSLVKLKSSILELKIVLLQSLKCNSTIEQSETVSEN